MSKDEKLAALMGECLIELAQRDNEAAGALPAEPDRGRGSGGPRHHGRPPRTPPPARHPALTMAFQFRPSEIAEGQYVVAQCRVCRDHRYLGRQFLLDHGGDMPIRDMQHRIRCIARPVGQKRGPACGGAMDLEMGAAIQPDRPSDWRG